jgi:hypothetical protein
VNVTEVILSGLRKPAAAVHARCARHRLDPNVGDPSSGCLACELVAHVGDH